ncbi:cell division protein SepF [Acidaminobacter sp. JC074]|uniref:cell division protein SepF n=1 Tax=Acidaminobacter sp. JC074 TaxID=2530199 RepID=UPI001F108F04|nr:cell division protein SepF [Acidaminobacter sp. JC074]MCH4890233.1 cell division protein SepF [Acidaminobacter sp. JC074]
MSDNIWKKMKYFVMGDEDEYEEDQEVEEVVEEKDDTVTPIVRNEDRNIITDSYVKPRTNLVDIKNNQNQLKVIVYKPTQYSDAEQIVKNLKSKKPVVVNLEEVEVELARKIFNFCSGAICALDGEMRKISKEIFILAPNNVTLDAEKTESIEADKTFDWRK